MPQAMTTGQLYVSRVLCYTQTQIGINVCHWIVQSHTGGGGSSDVFAQNLDTVLAPRYKAAISSLAFYRGVQVQQFASPPPAADNVIASFGPGAGAASLLPQVMSGVITKRTAISSRRTRGRMYIPFPSADMADVNGSPTAGYVQLLDTIGAGYDGVFIVGVAPNTSSVTAVVLHTTPPPISEQEITGFIGSTKFGSQHRRGQYGQANTPPF